MAPKDKKPKAPPEPPSCWVAVDERMKESVRLDEGTVVSLRAGRPSAVRGKEALAGGRYRLAYEIVHADSPAGWGLLLGVCSANAQAGQKASAGIKAIFGQTERPPFAQHSHATAWGLCPSSGQLVRTDDAAKGLFDGAAQSKPIFEKPMKSYRQTTGTTVVLELSLPPLDPEQAALAKRSFSTNLHPLHKRGGPTGAAAARVPTLSFSINGGPLVDSGVHGLPESLYPWVMLAREGDAVSLVSLERFDDE